MRGRVSKVVLVGSPNVGKSAIFNFLTGSYVAVSNYPGTTVDISTGFFKNGNCRYEVIDTPGIYSLIPLTEEEKVTRMFLSSISPDVVVHVIDAKNIRRMLTMTLQLIDAGLPVILCVNIMDEARDRGMLINTDLLEKILGIPVVATSAIHKASLAILRKSICNYRPVSKNVFKYKKDIEQAVDKIAGKISLDYGLSKRAVGLLLLQGDALTLAQAQAEKSWPDIADLLKQVLNGEWKNFELALAAERQAIVDKISTQVIRYANCQPKSRITMAIWLGKITRQPITGIPILCLVLYFGLYQFVGRFGAGYLVDYLNNNVFIPVINPVAIQIVNAAVPWEWAKSLLVGEYGVFTMGFRYAMAIVLPIVGTFFLVFAVLEDSGYLPRLAMLVDNVFRYFGLNGRAVIPLTLGLGCGTMAVMVTRTLQSNRERLLATFLLALTIPCSAQLGVVLALLSHQAMAVVVWSMYMLTIFVTVAWLGAKLVPGSRSSFYMELPPLRVPLASNVVKKAYTRVSWYFMEVLPIFILTSLVLWAGQQSGMLNAIISGLKPAMLLIGLPPEMAKVFLLGFFRRDYGAAGLYDLVNSGMLTEVQLSVAAVAITLFVPCIAQFTVMIKERGVYITTAMMGLIIAITFVSAGLLHKILTFL